MVFCWKEKGYTTALWVIIYPVGLLLTYTVFCIFQAPLVNSIDMNNDYSLNLAEQPNCQTWQEGMVPPSHSMGPYQLQQQPLLQQLEESAIRRVAQVAPQPVQPPVAYSPNLEQVYGECLLL